MTCLECHKELSYIDHKNAMELFGVELCRRHYDRLLKLNKRQKTSLQAIRLYYGLKEAGENPMLAWWDGKKSVDIALPRVKLNVEIDHQPQLYSHKRAMEELEEAMQSMNEGFTTLRIPHMLIAEKMRETVQDILQIKAGLQQSQQVI
ncbi:hypothetical protein PP178_07530 [Zeaxanthinibacter sp. PT1]|uniref:hypothetical protein n=1 Tax=Zeaxanthinibacter TaxID=561554 RepID=UPI00234B9B9F|nr:hypothetical protein [Zeaxanthinibacter sp. PT1]MDC6351400.1 hypothetical protein [Zeaxanthinibacter sp. PT1]